ncbi:MAG: prolyl oligopeptidase family serine peptidase [Candidatus Alcyoniella australis]|nr:prolyl oligopeptidase family serine peptidase [Candidatus Alcyoniella australis]
MVIKPQPLVETINGYQVADPYRFLEDEQAAAAWIDSQNLRTTAYLESVATPGVAQRVSELYGIGYSVEPELAGGKLFYLKLETGDEQPKLYMRSDNIERVLLDPILIDATGKTALDWYYPSPGGSYLAYGLSKDGDENSTLYLLDTVSGETLADTIGHTRHCSIAWLSNQSGFYYTLYPDGTQYNRHVYFHELGSDPNQDRYIFGDDRAKTDWPDLRISEDDRYLLINVETGTTSNDAYILERSIGEIVPIVEGLDAQVWALEMLGSKILALTTLDAPNRRLVLIDPRDPDQAKWTDLIEQRDYPLEDLAIAGERIVALYLENAVSQMRVFNLQGIELGTIELPAPGSVSRLAVQRGSSELVFSYSSFLYPQSLFRADPMVELRAEPLVLTSTGGSFDPSNFVVRYVEYPSYDGTLVPMFIVHKRGIELNGDCPTILYGYGGFGISLGPYFSRTNLFWIERGGVYAVANIRGGGELGEVWHQAGMRERKFQVFEDFQYAMRYLIRQGYTNPERLAIRGGSNGGLLVGAMITRAPYLFGCAVGQVGLYDMVRYHRFPPGELWVPEYGSADEPGQTGYIWAYSPYHQVLPKVAYPPSLILTAESDTRVHWMHSAKFAAALQASGNARGPILFWLQRQAGHGQGMNWSDAAQQTIRSYYFVIEQIGDPATP